MIRPHREPVKAEVRIVRWIKLFGLFLGVYLVFVLAKGLLELRGGYGRLTEARRELAEEEIKSVELGQKHVQVQTPSYLEQMARDKLNMQREGETVVVISDVDQKLKNSRTQELKTEEVEVNYMKWWKLIE